MEHFDQRLAGAWYGIAIGDAMGAPVEGRSAAEIFARFGSHDFSRFLPGKDPHRGKGFGRITDDTLMTEALARAYAARLDHLDAHGYADYLLPEVCRTSVWVPERQQEMPIFERLYWPEKYPWQRLVLANAEPRTAGVGNMVNCGLAMFIMPVGAVNAGDPAAAYQEAAALGAAHNESYAVEAAAVLAAAYAEAFAANATLESVIEVATRFARDGTRAAVRAALAAVDRGADTTTFCRSIRAAVAPFDGRSRHTADDEASASDAPSDAGRPSRVQAIEEVPVALAVVHYAAGDVDRALRAAVSYGRDCDSIAGMAVGLVGAQMGANAIPMELRSAVDEANRRDFSVSARQLADVVRRIQRQDAERQARRRDSVCS